MAIKSYQEKQIRKQILNKLKPRICPGSHDKCYIEDDGKLLTKVKIPNNHNKVMHKNKSKFIARALKLDDDQFNDLIDCPLSGPDYYLFLKKIS